MKRIKLKSSILALGLIVGLAVGASNAGASAAKATKNATTTKKPTVTKKPTASSKPMTTFKDDATSLSFQYPSTWTTDTSNLSLTIPGTIPGVDAPLIIGIEKPDTLEDVALLCVYKFNIDLGTGNVFQSQADTMAKSMFSKEQLDDMLPSVLQTFEANGIKASVVDIKASVPMKISGNTFYRSSIKIKFALKDFKSTVNYEYIVGCANDQFFIFMGITMNEKDSAELDAIINSISLKK